MSIIVLSSFSKFWIALINGLLILVWTLTPIKAENLQFGLSAENILITPDFSGANLTVFGVIEDYDPVALDQKQYQVVVVARGMPEKVIVRKKEKVLGIWVNRKARKFSNVPRFYSLSTNTPITHTINKKLLQKYEIGVSNLNIKLIPKDEKNFVLTAPEFLSSIKRLRKENNLYIEKTNSLTFLTETLFRTKINLPANISVGKLNITAYLFKNGQFVANKSSSVYVRKSGLERWLYNFAHQKSFLYGIIAVIIAAFTGWLANTLARKN